MSAEVQQQATDPFLMSVLASRFEAIIREMTNTVMKASRSAVIKNARDFSCGLLTYDHRLVCVEEAMPIHVSALDLTTKPITGFFDDVSEGDAYLNNSPYTGGTHHADLTVCVPVFYEGEPMFWAIARCHHADVGAPSPTTYLPYGATIYEEGLHFPCLRIQEKGQDRHDIVRMCMLKIRVNKIWYGDYQAQVGACRVGERRLQELVKRYGKDAIKTFIEDWMAYGERRAIAAIANLPKGSWTCASRHDPIPGVAPDGIPVQVTVTVDPEEGLVTVDARDNVDCVPGGVNLSEACATGSCRIGVFYNIDPSIPHNEGSASRVKVLLRDGCVVGRPAYPVGTSVATTNVNDRLINSVTGCFAQMGKPHGLAEGGYPQAAGMAVISGTDPRRPKPEPYINQICASLAGGPAVQGHDGWLTFEAPNGGGVLVLDTIEVDEHAYPILFEERRVAEDTAGPGEWDGAPGTRLTYRPLGHDMTVIYCSDGELSPAKGVLGGHDGAPASNWKRRANRQLDQLPGFHEELCRQDEAIVSITCGGGGYGETQARDPARVVRSVNRRWLSPKKAEAVYAVKVRPADNGVDYELDEAGTAALRRVIVGGTQHREV